MAHHVVDTLGAGLLLASYLNEALRQLMLPESMAFRQAEELTRREIECLCWAAKGLPAKLIADRMGIAYSTVTAHHLPAIRRKLGATTTREAVALAVYHRLIEP
jgi:LuxR family transcriptional regulator